ncbi:MAG: quinone-dependent dihydroorotate dehydrogenase [Nocardioides sp.]
MTRAYDALFEQVLTRIEPERAHHLGFRAVRVGSPVLRRALRPITTAPVAAFGLQFPHPLGLAAGFDKNAVGIDALGALGFGHVEIGTVTGLPQPGNPTPRLFRLPADRAIINRMGFNNEGAEAVSRRLRQRASRMAPGGAPGPILGVNIGKSKVVPEDDEAAVIADYERSCRLLAPYADYLVINVSSPNTPGLRSLQAVDRLGPLVRSVRETAAAAVPERRVPLLVKIAPDLADEDIVEVAQLALDTSLDGIIATNTTIGREGLRSDASLLESIGAGGLSGAPLRERSLAVLKLLHDHVGERLTLVSVGGISTAADAAARLAAGATLVQAYSAFIYGGPLWPRRIVRGLLEAEGSR